MNESGAGGGVGVGIAEPHLPGGFLQDHLQSKDPVQESGGDLLGEASSFTRTNSISSNSSNSSSCSSSNNNITSSHTSDNAAVAGNGTANNNNNNGSSSCGQSAESTAVADSAAVSVNNENSNSGTANDIGNTLSSAFSQDDLDFDRELVSDGFALSRLLGGDSASPSNTNWDSLNDPLTSSSGANDAASSTSNADQSSSAAENGGSAAANPSQQAPPQPASSTMAAANTTSQSVVGGGSSATTEAPASVSNAAVVNNAGTAPSSEAGVSASLLTNGTNSSAQMQSSYNNAGYRPWEAPGDHTQHSPVGSNGALSSAPNSTPTSSSTHYIQSNQSSVTTSLGGSAVHRNGSQLPHSQGYFHQQQIGHQSHQVQQPQQPQQPLPHHRYSNHHLSSFQPPMFQSQFNFTDVVPPNTQAPPTPPIPTSAQSRYPGNSQAGGGNGHPGHYPTGHPYHHTQENRGQGHDRVHQFAPPPHHGLQQQPQHHVQHHLAQQQHHKLHQQHQQPGMHPNNGLQQQQMSPAKYNAGGGIVRRPNTVLQQQQQQSGPPSMSGVGRFSPSHPPTAFSSPSSVGGGVGGGVSATATLTTSSGSTVPTTNHWDNNSMSQHHHHSQQQQQAQMTGLANGGSGVSFSPATTPLPTSEIGQRPASANSCGDPRLTPSRMTPTHHQLSNSGSNPPTTPVGQQQLNTTPNSSPRYTDLSSSSVRLPVRPASTSGGGAGTDGSLLLDGQVAAVSSTLPTSPDTLTANGIGGGHLDGSGSLFKPPQAQVMNGQNGADNSTANLTLGLTGDGVDPSVQPMDTNGDEAPKTVAAHSLADTQQEKSAKKKRKRCGECTGCQRKDNCRECAPCRNDKSHQICKMRRCDQLTEKKVKSKGPKGGKGAANKNADQSDNNKTNGRFGNGTNGNTNGTTTAEPATTTGWTPATPNEPATSSPTASATAAPQQQPPTPQQGAGGVPGAAPTTPWFAAAAPGPPGHMAAPVPQPPTHHPHHPPAGGGMLPPHHHAAVAPPPHHPHPHAHHHHPHLQQHGAAAAQRHNLAAHHAGHHVPSQPSASSLTFDTAYNFGGGSAGGVGGMQDFIQQHNPFGTQDPRVGQNPLGGVRGPVAGSHHPHHAAPSGAHHSPFLDPQSYLGPHHAHQPAVQHGLPYHVNVSADKNLLMPTPGLGFPGDSRAGSTLSPLTSLTASRMGDRGQHHLNKHAVNTSDEYQVSSTRSPQPYKEQLHSGLSILDKSASSASSSSSFLGSLYNVLQPPTSAGLFPEAGGGFVDPKLTTFIDPVLFNFHNQ